MSYSAKDKQVGQRVLKRFRLRLRTGATIGAGSYTKGVILLVGEQTSHPDENKYHIPFCSTKGCSGWLNALLEDAGIPEERLFWINALDNDGSDVDLRKIYDELEPCMVIALGNIARDKLKKFDIEGFGIVPHPQYWKRFKHKQPYPLINVLKGFMELDRYEQERPHNDFVIEYWKYNNV